MNGKHVRYGMAFLTSFAISAGGAYISAVSNGFPPTWEGIVTDVTVPVVTGIIAGAMAVQKLMETPP